MSNTNTIFGYSELFVAGIPAKSVSENKTKNRSSSRNKNKNKTITKYYQINNLTLLKAYHAIYYIDDKELLFISLTSQLPNKYWDFIDIESSKK